jgi:predicted amidohydrolase
MVLRSLLDVTAFLPSSLTIPSADGDRGGIRHVCVRYAIKPIKIKNLPQREPNTAFTVAIAPLLETGEDLAITLSACGGWYCVRPTYSPKRLTATLHAALDLKAELLFLPECTVSVEQLNWLQGEIPTTMRSYFRTRGELPSLRYVLAGVASPASYPSQGANYVIIFDNEGQEICRQDKLFRWNLNQDQIKRYGLDIDLNTKSVEIKENIAGGSEVMVVDLEGVGRFITLICADVDENAPGDWLLAHVRTDWLNAPIMDKSTCWTFDPKGLRGPWITRRAYRAACASQCKVVVSNSMTLTHRLNRTNEQLGVDKIFSQCGIGLLLDGGGATVTFRQVMAPLRAVTPIVVAELWKNNWDTVNPVNA